MAFPPALTITNKGWPAAPLNAKDKVYIKPGKQVDAPRAAFICEFYFLVLYDVIKDADVLHMFCRRVQYYYCRL